MNVVERQLAAYNAHDADELAACYSEDALIEDARGAPLMRGRDEVRAEYERFFRDYPTLHGEVRHRITLGEYVIDEEEISGWHDSPVLAVAIYHIAGDLIDHVRLYE